MSDLWADWADHYRGLGIDENSITQDGVADEAAYRAASPRIVFVLKDSNAWPGHSLHEAMVPGPIRMMIMVSRWAHGLLHDFPSIEEADRRENQIAAIRQVAAINLKKSAGAAVNDWADLVRFAQQDSHLLRRQLGDLKPDVMVACGTWDPLLDVVGCAKTLTPGSPKVLRDPATNALILGFRHPARAHRVPTYDALRDLMRHAKTARV